MGSFRVAGPPVRVSQVAPRPKLGAEVNRPRPFALLALALRQGERRPANAEPEKSRGGEPVWLHICPKMSNIRQQHPETIAKQAFGGNSYLEARDRDTTNYVVGLRALSSFPGRQTHVLIAMKHRSLQQHRRRMTYDQGISNTTRT